MKSAVYMYTGSEEWKFSLKFTPRKVIQLWKIVIKTWNEFYLTGPPFIIQDSMNKLYVDNIFIKLKTSKINFQESW